MTTAWLMIAAGEDRQHGGNHGYDDDPERHYEWDDTVANHRAPRGGDVIVLWDKQSLIGASVIESIEEGDAEKERNRCPSCGKTKIRMRKKNPNFRCYDAGCLAEFDEPTRERLQVHTYRTNHEAGWVNLDGKLGAKQLRKLCVEPLSIQSIRKLKWPEFAEALRIAGGRLELGMLEDDGRLIRGGHKQALVRVRVGQREFRMAQLERYKNRCAFTGPQPTHVLDAAHLYRYSELAEHHKDGGLLLRKDLHRLFDLGQLAVDPTSLKIDVAAELQVFSDYAALHGRRLAVAPDAGTLKWIRAHWKQHRL